MTPLRPPLAETHACAQCPDGRVIGVKRRLCSKCREANKAESDKRRWANRAYVTELGKRVDALEAHLTELLRPRRRRMRAITGRSE
jgi:hypothetical protein